MKKFRAWHEKHGWASKISVFKDGVFDVSYSADGICRTKPWPFGPLSESSDAANDGWILEQFTGCVDKNGEEIYEGDIIRVMDRLQLPPSMLREVGDKMIGYVLFDSAMFCFGIGISGSAVQARGLGMMKPELIEVIGNIHENKELLET